MGHDKALLIVEGAPLAARVAAALSAAGARGVVCIGGDVARLRDAGLAAIDDDHPGAGPLGGILAALRWAPAPMVAVLACDLVSPDPGAIEAVVDALAAAPDAHAAVPEHSGIPQWLHAAWRRTTAPALTAHFEAGERAIHRAAATLDIVMVTGLARSALADADTPEDLPPHR